MKKITSFTVNHLKLVPGVYVSRKDFWEGTCVTTFDIRMTSPNEEPVMNTAEIHAIEHLGATFLRNHKDFKESVLYFGPMGCRTGFYLLLFGEHTSQDILPLLKEMFAFIAGYQGQIPGAAPKMCIRDSHQPCLFCQTIDRNFDRNDIWIDGCLLYQF